MLSHEELQERLERIQWLTSLRGVGKMNSCGDFPILYMTRHRGLRAAARASAAAMREQRDALLGYGEDPNNWPIATPEEIDHNRKRFGHRRDMLASEACLCIGLDAIPKSGAYLAQENKCRFGTPEGEPGALPSYMLISLETGARTELLQGVSKPGTLSGKSCVEEGSWHICLSRPGARSGDKEVLAALKWLGCTPSQLQVMFESQDERL